MSPTNPKNPPGEPNAVSLPGAAIRPRSEGVVQTDRRSLTFGLGGVIGLSLSHVLAPVARAQDEAAGYPSRRVRIVVPFTPGGTTDITARVIGEKLQQKWGQPVVVENRPGGGATIGSDLVAKSPPDGYTLVVGVTRSHGINVSLMKKMPYHPLDDFEPITQGTRHGNVIFVHPSFPADNIPQLLELARKNPGQYTFGNDGKGTGSHLVMELLLSRSGVKMQALPYKGATPMINDVVGQQIPVGVTGIPSAMNAYRSGRIKILGISSLERSEMVPELPTVAEQGFPGFSGEPWSGFFAPKGTPRAIIDKLARDINEAMRLPDVEQRMAALGTRFYGGSPESFRKFVADEIVKWAEAVKAAGIEPE
jgi:tripartite-type tricarboxylate transporter receptor subunit TctC